MGIRIDAEILNDIHLAQEYEWLERNRNGAYAASTVIGMNKKRSHGLLVAPHGENNEKIVVLSKFEESVFIKNNLHEISVNRYIDTFFPQGYTYLKEYEQSPFPKFIYQVEDRIIHKTLFLLEDENTLVVRYELKNQGEPIKLVIKPFLAIRPNHQLIKESQGLNTDSYLGQGWVRWAPRANRPELYVYFTRGEFVPATLWYHNFYYPQDGDETKKETEDLFNPGFFQLQLLPYETVDLFVSTGELDPFEMNYETLYRKEAAKRFYPQTAAQGDRAFLDLKANFLKALPLQKDATLSISLLDKETSLRDLLFVMPALLHDEQTRANFVSLFRKMIHLFESGLLPAHYPPEQPPFYTSADPGLWIFQLWHEYYLKTGGDELLQAEIYDIFRSVIDAFTKGTSNNIYMDKDGLLNTGNSTTSTSWISLIDREGKVLRYGKLFEMNALWYNALKIMEQFSLILKKKRLAGRYRNSAQKTADAFFEVFYDKESGGFFDFVNHASKNRDFRINQIIPLSLSYSVVGKEYTGLLLQKAEEKLVTPFGLKSKEGAVGSADGFISRKKAEYYNGAIWPWAIQLYVRACLNHKVKDSHFVKDLREYFQPILRLLSDGLLGYIPEALKLNEEIHQNGIADYLPSIASFIWMEETFRDVLRE